MILNSFNILHISDFHYENNNKNQQIVIKAFLEDLAKLIKEDNSIALLVFSGDLVNKGDENSFKKAYSKLIKPALDICNLSNDELIIIPGNHDVSRKKIDEFLDAGLNAIDNRDKLNKFVDKHKENSTYFSRLEDYYFFLDEIKGNNLITSNYLYQTYVFEYENFKVGVAGLNSSWKSTGTDYGNLMVGERQIDNALEDIQDCDIKIAVLHHSSEWLTEFDKRDTDKRLSNEFDVILSGHNHEQKPKFSYDNSGSCILNQAGCLYHSREYYNGYSLIKIQSEGTVEINFRTYFDNRRKFDLGLDVIEKGSIVFNFKKKDNAPIQFRSSYLDQYKERYIEDANHSLIISDNPVSVTGDIRTAFVAPILAKEPEAAVDYNQNDIFDKSKIEKIDLSEIIDNRLSYIISGQNESGKSTLLRYIGIKALEDSSGNIVPISLNYSKIDTQGSNPFYRAILSSLAGINKEDEVLNLLQNGRLIILIDDFDVSNNLKFQKFKEFLTKFNSCKYILSVDENMYSTLKLDNVKISSVYFEKIYIHSFKISHIRELAKHWLIGEADDREKLVQKVTSSIIEMGLPFTPTIVTFFLYILESNTDINQANKSTLVQKFIEVLLNKAGQKNENLRDFDYRNKEHLLASISCKLHKKNSTSLTRNDLEAYLLEYSQLYGFKFPISKTVDSLIECGLLNDLCDEISFKLKAFAEYFAAIFMTDNDDWYNYVLSEPEYYKYKNVIDYYSGLKRNDDKLITLLCERLEILSELSDLSEINLLDIEQFSLAFDFFDGPVKKDIIDKSDKYELSPEEEDNFLDIAPIRKPNQSLENESTDDINFIFSSTLDILSVAIRNSELISDKQLKFTTIATCFEKWSLSNLGVLKYIKNNPEDFPIAISDVTIEKTIEIGEDGTYSKSSEDEKKLYPLYILVQSIMTGNIVSTFSSDKLAIYIEAVLKEPNTPLITKFNAVCVYSYYRLPNYRKYVEMLLKELYQNSFLQDVFILHLLRIRKEVKSVEVKKYIEDIVSSTLASRHYGSSQRNGIADKMIKEERVATIKRSLQKIRN